MLKKALALAFLLVGTVFVFAEQETVTLDEAVQNAVKRIAGFLPQAGAERVVVVEFSNQDFDAPESLKAVSNRIMNDLRVSLKERDIHAVDVELVNAVRNTEIERVGDEIDDQSEYGQSLLAYENGTPYKMKGSFFPQGEKDFSMEITIIDAGKALDLSILQTVRIDGKLADLLGITWNDTSWKERWLWIGGWGGISPWAKQDISFNPLSGPAFGVQIKGRLGNFAPGVEAGLQRVRYSENNEKFATVGMVSALASLFISPGYNRVLVEPFVGVYYNFPNKNWDGKSGIEGLTPFGAVAGIDVGGKVGPGVLFFDARVGLWYEEPVIRFFSVGVGYKIGLLAR
ncbi:MAG: hypothetical protein LBL45_06335 [Treponema sp.]|jgi:hypothetical protein|nr:hypothetical protein [Treponema sp.]